MQNQTNDNQFNSTETFYKELIKVLSQVLNEKLPLFLDYCIHTINIEPIKEILALLNRNVF